MRRYHVVVGIGLLLLASAAASTASGPERPDPVALAAAARNEPVVVRVLMTSGRAQEILNDESQTTHMIRKRDTTEP